MTLAGPSCRRVLPHRRAPLALASIVALLRMRHTREGWKHRLTWLSGYADGGAKPDASPRQRRASALAASKKVSDYIVGSSKSIRVSLQHLAPPAAGSQCVPSPCAMLGPTGWLQGSMPSAGCDVSVSLCEPLLICSWYACPELAGRDGITASAQANQVQEQPASKGQESASQTSPFAWQARYCAYSFTRRWSGVRCSRGKGGRTR